MDQNRDMCEIAQTVRLESGRLDCESEHFRMTDPNEADLAEFESDIKNLIERAELFGWKASARLLVMVVVSVRLEDLRCQELELPSL